MWCSTSADTSLGVFDASRVRDLGLPTITALGSVGSYGPGPGTPAPEPLPSTPAKFQLGETLPVVSARIVRRILHGDFVDMAELTEENLELELRRSLEGDERKPLPAHKLRPVQDLLSWVRFFCHCAGIVARTNPSKAVDLWAYMAVMVSGGEKGDWCRAYDSHFRQQLTTLDKQSLGGCTRLYTPGPTWPQLLVEHRKQATYPLMRAAPQEQRSGGWQHTSRSTMAEHVLLHHAAISTFVHAAVAITAGRFVFILGRAHSHPPVLIEPARGYSQLVMVILPLLLHDI